MQEFRDVQFKEVKEVIRAEMGLKSQFQSNLESKRFRCKFYLCRILT